MTLVLTLVELASGRPSPFDGQYLKEYDPNRDGETPDGDLLLAHIVTTPDIEEAMKFESMQEVHKIWTRVDDRDPIRPDGKPNRPLTAFTIQASPYQEDE
jgi:hypothetical protein